MKSFVSDKNKVAAVQSAFSTPVIAAVQPEISNEIAPEAEKKSFWEKLLDIFKF